MGVEGFADDGQVVGELTEHQSAMMVLFQLLHQFQQLLQFGAGQFEFRRNQARMAGGPAQSGEFGQHVETLALFGDAALGQALDGLASDCGQQGGFFGAGFDGDDDLGTRWQLVQYLRLQAAQQKGPDQPAQGVALGRARIPLQGGDETLGEAVLAAEQSWVEDAHQAPELAQMVFDRGAGGGDTGIGLDPSHRQRSLRLGILYRLGFVEHQRGKTDFGEGLDIDGQQAVTDQQHRTGRESIEGSAAIAVAVGDDLQRRRKSIQFIAPVADHGGGGHDQRRALGCSCRQHCQCLDGLAQAHVVGQAGAAAPIRQTHHPAIAVKLIVAQFHLQIARQRVILGSRAFHPLQLLAEALIKIEFCLGIEQWLQCGSRYRRQFDATAVVGQCPQAVETAGQILTQGNDAVAFEPHETPLRRWQRFQQRGQRDHAAVIQRQTALGVEPILLCLDLELQAGRAMGAGHGPAPLRRPVQRDLLRIFRQGRQDLQCARRVAEIQPLDRLRAGQFRHALQQRCQGLPLSVQITGAAYRQALTDADQFTVPAARQQIHAEFTQWPHPQAHAQALAQRFDQGMDAVIDVGQGFGIRQTRIHAQRAGQARQQLDQLGHAVFGQIATVLDQAGDAQMLIGEAGQLQPIIDQRQPRGRLRIGLGTQGERQALIGAPFDREHRFQQLEAQRPLIGFRDQFGAAAEHIEHRTLGPQALGVIAAVWHRQGLQQQTITIIVQRQSAHGRLHLGRTAQLSPRSPAACRLALFQKANLDMVTVGIQLPDHHPDTRALAGAGRFLFRLVSGTRQFIQRTQQTLPRALLLQPERRPGACGSVADGRQQIDQRLELQGLKMGETVVHRLRNHGIERRSVPVRQQQQDQGGADVQLGLWLTDGGLCHPRRGPGLAAQLALQGVVYPAIGLLSQLVLPQFAQHPLQQRAVVRIAAGQQRQARQRTRQFQPGLGAGKLEGRLFRRLLAGSTHEGHHRSRTITTNGEVQQCQIPAGEHSGVGHCSEHVATASNPGRHGNGAHRHLADIAARHQRDGRIEELGHVRQRRVRAHVQQVSDLTQCQFRIQPQQALEYDRARHHVALGFIPIQRFPGRAVEQCPGDLLGTDAGQHQRAQSEGLRLRAMEIADLAHPLANLLAGLAPQGGAVGVLKAVQQVATQRRGAQALITLMDRLAEQAGHRHQADAHDLRRQTGSADFIAGKSVQQPEQVQGGAIGPQRQQFHQGQGPRRCRGEYPHFPIGCVLAHRAIHWSE